MRTVYRTRDFCGNMSGGIYLIAKGTWCLLMRGRTDRVGWNSRERKIVETVEGNYREGNLRPNRFSKLLIFISRRLFSMASPA